MKNLILTCAFLVFAATATAQQTPTKKSKTTVDSTMQKSSTHKTDTVKSQHKNKAGKKTKSTNPAVNSNRKDTVTSPKTSPKNP
ncbi:hypothetical protein [Flavobacterium fluviale]|uniref:Uncharacterized protein n=1 Tax=Flavobacterium fluviale TaxID=2249356 RepID=A0A344LW04_9FLAO|nr:hypothetical protein [Flavobacterium fluviale]AXB58096.1 hypothetical protein HYN86_16445 [Flavobacterium fluviale]